MENIEKKVGATAEAATTSAKANKKYIATIVGLGVMTAVVVVLQLLSSVIRFGPFSITLALTPIIVGGALYGIWGGGWLGLVMGLTVLLSGDATAFLEVNAVGTILVVLIKGAAAGLVASLVYKAIEKKNVYPAVICAGITAPVVNTGIFFIGCLIFFMDTIREWAGQSDAIGFIFTSMIGLNFFVELAVNMALATVTVTIIGYAKKILNNR